MDTREPPGGEAQISTYEWNSAFEEQLQPKIKTLMMNLTLGSQHSNDKGAARVEMEKGGL